MTYRFAFKATIAATVLLSSAAEAQNNPFAGNWQCSMTYTEFNPNGSRHSGFSENTILQLYPNGNFAVQGQQMSGIGGTWGFQGQGEWRFGPSQGGMAMGAQGVRSDPTFGQAPYAFTAFLAPDGSGMYNKHEVPQPNGQGIQARTLIQCQRG